MESLSLPGDAAAADAGKTQMKSDAAAEGGNQGYRTDRFRLSPRRLP